MKNKLELKHLAPYFPYAVLVGDGRTPFELTETNFSNVYNYITEIYLRPLSDLTKEVFHNEEKIVPLHEILMEDRFFTKGFLELFGHESCKYSTVKKLLEYHFDIFGLIEKGLAVDINSIKYSN